MKHLCPSLVILIGVIVVGADRTNGEDLSGSKDRSKSWEKRRDQDVEPSKLQPGFWETSSSTTVEKAAGDQERAKEEKSLKEFTAYDAIQSVLVNALKPKPVVDTAEESELLAPNHGSKVQALGDFVVKGSETLSRALNSAIEVPKMAILKLSSGATQALNQLGAYLVGI